MPISQSKWARYVCAAFGVTFIGFGINVMINPVSALSFYELSYPSLPEQRRVVDTLLAVYGYRDIFMGLAIIAPAVYGSTKTLGLIMLAAGSVAGVDGWACYSIVGEGAMNHWGYAPLLVVMGAVLTAGC